MALKFIEGFDDGMTAQRASFPVDLVAGRFGGNAGQVPWYADINFTLPITVSGTFIMGFACRFTNTAGYWRMVLAGNMLVGVTAAGNITLTNNNGGALQATSSSAPFNVANVWRYIELKYVLTTGACTIRVDGVTVITGTVSTTASISTLSYAVGNGNSSTMAWDDMYICDASGTVNNDFLGDVRVQTLLPSADGTNNGLSPSTGTGHAVLVDEATPNTTDYVSSSVAGTRDTYQFQDLSSNTANVFGVEIANYASKDAAGPGAIKNIARVNGTDYASPVKGLSSSWTANTNLLELNPSTGAPWAPADVNSAEFGIEVA